MQAGDHTGAYYGYVWFAFHCAPLTTPEQ
jgi:hypothetical protein